MDSVTVAAGSNVKDVVSFARTRIAEVARTMNDVARNAGENNHGDLPKIEFENDVIENYKVCFHDWRHISHKTAS